MQPIRVYYENSTITFNWDSNFGIQNGIKNLGVGMDHWLSYDIKTYGVALFT